MIHEGSLVTEQNRANGRVAEWLKAPDSKSDVVARLPWVQIPPLPPLVFPKKSEDFSDKRGEKWPSVSESVSKLRGSGSFAGT